MRLLFISTFLITLTQLNAKQKTSLFNPEKILIENKEISHMHDVQIVLITLAILTLISFYFYPKINLRKEILSTLILGIFASFFFNELFIILHRVLFPQGNWTFSYGSLILQIWPYKTFINLSEKIIYTNIFLVGKIYIVKCLKIFKI